MPKHRKHRAKTPSKRKSPSSKPGFIKLAVAAAVEFSQERKDELIGFLWAAFGLVLGLSLIPLQANLLGIVGKGLFRASFGAFGLSGYALPFAFAAWGLAKMLKIEVHAPSVKVAGWLLILMPVAILLGLFASQPIASGAAQGLYWGGAFGFQLAKVAAQWLATTGTVVLCMVMMGVALFLLGQEGAVKSLFLHMYQRMRVAFIQWQAAQAAQAERRGAEAEEEAEDSAKPKRRSKSELEKRAKAIAEAVDEELEEETLAQPEKPAKGKKAELAEEEDSISVDRPLSTEERARMAEAFFKRRTNIKVSEAGPRVNEMASTQAVSLGAENPPAISELTDYQFPSIELLKPAPQDNTPKAEGYQEMSATLERALASFGVSAKVVEVCAGPTVTRYELSLAPGVKMARVVNLADDIALATKVGSVRIEGPLPGKGTLGVEIPNAKSQPVYIRELLGTDEFQKTGHKLVFGVGKDIGGSMVFSNLAEMPHLLVAGSTGSGKSVMINAIIISLLYRAAPDEVKLLMVDPKRVELTPYDNIPHLLRPVVANPREAAGALRLLVQEMEDRYKLLAAAGVRKIDEYNVWVAERTAERASAEAARAEALAKGDEAAAEAVEVPAITHKRMPYIVAIIDELADLMMVSANEVESSICRLAQLARGVGIHLVIATQRPSVDVITGLIKSNLPSRIAFQVASKIDSRTILDGSGAEALLGKGDMLYSPGNLSKSLRVQGCLVSTSEVEKVVAHVKKQGAPVFDDRFMRIDVRDEAVSTADDGEGSGSDDPLYEESVRHVLAAGQASTSVLQRRMRIGYGRAAYLLDLMEKEGIIGPKDGNRPRKVLLKPEDYSIEREPAMAQEDQP
jgi:S-DNA-T family DNA segregation ATPase FtsK/SpoIIIE